MPGIARLVDNSLLVVFEGFWAHGWGHFSIQCRRSFDDGKTWNAGRVLYSALKHSNQTANAGAPQVAVDPGTGTVWVSFMTDEDAAQISWPGDAASKVIAARDTGRNGARLEFVAADRKLLAAGPGAMWPGLFTAKGATWAVWGRGGSSFAAGPLRKGNAEADGVQNVVL